MRRRAMFALVVALLAGSAVAFAVTESLKLERSPITGTQVDKTFSPVCGCPQRRARVAFRLRKIDSMAVTMVDSAGHRVRTLVKERRFNRGAHHFFWDGRSDDGGIVPEGEYRPKVRLSDAGRTIVLPNPIRVDVTPPRVMLLSVEPRVFSPGGDGRNDRVTARYRVDEPATVVLTVDGDVRIRRRGLKTTGRIHWPGTILGRPVSPGTYRLALEARDRAGNDGVPTRRVPVVVRYIRLSRDRVDVQPGARFTVRVVTDARSYRWSLAARGGRSSRLRLRLRAPANVGRYTLTLRAGGFTDRALIVVARERSP